MLWLMIAGDRSLSPTPGNVADITMAEAIVAAVAAPRRLIADKASDAESFRNWLAQRRIKAVIPSTASRTTPYPNRPEGLPQTRGTCVLIRAV